VGKEQKHLSLSIKKDDKIIKAIYFGITDEQKDLIENHTKYDVAFNLMADQWNGEEYVKLNIVDIKPHNNRLQTMLII
jgi:hypothetical protein